jgi:hypothetical protein
MCRRMYSYIVSFQHVCRHIYVQNVIVCVCTCMSISIRMCTHQYQMHMYKHSHMTMYSHMYMYITCTNIYASNITSPSISSPLPPSAFGRPLRSPLPRPTPRPLPRPLHNQEHTQCKIQTLTHTQMYTCNVYHIQLPRFSPQTVPFLFGLHRHEYEYTCIRHIHLPRPLPRPVPSFCRDASTLPDSCRPPINTPRRGSRNFPTLSPPLPSNPEPWPPFPSPDCQGPL